MRRWQHYANGNNAKSKHCNGCIITSYTRLVNYRLWGSRLIIRQSHYQGQAALANYQSALVVSSMAGPPRCLQKSTYTLVFQTLTLHAVGESLSVLGKIQTNMEGRKAESLCTMILIPQNSRKSSLEVLEGSRHLFHDIEWKSVKCSRVTQRVWRFSAIQVNLR